MRKPKITLAEARRIITPDHAKALARSLRLAVTDWNEDYGKSQFILASNRAARPIIVGAHFYYHAARDLEGKGGVHFGSDQQQRFIAFGEKVAIRAKQLTRNLQAVNYPTPHALDWVRQVPLDGDFAPAVRLEFGYRFDLTGTMIKDAFITLPNGIEHSVNDWVWQVWGEPASDVFGVQRAFGRPASPETDVFYYEDLSAAV